MDKAQVRLRPSFTVRVCIAEVPRVPGKAAVAFCFSLSGAE